MVTVFRFVEIGVEGAGKRPTFVQLKIQAKAKKNGNVMIKKNFKSNAVTLFAKAEWPNERNQWRCSLFSL